MTVRLRDDLELTSALSGLLSSQQTRPLAVEAASAAAQPSPVTQQAPSSFPQVAEAMDKMQRAADVAMSTLGASVGGDAASLNQARQATYRSIGTRERSSCLERCRPSLHT